MWHIAILPKLDLSTSTLPKWFETNTKPHLTLNEPYTMPFDQIKRKGNKNRNTHMSLRLYLKNRSKA
jgi:hypothetical protein